MHVVVVVVGVVLGVVLEVVLGVVLGIVLEVVLGVVLGVVLEVPCKKFAQLAQQVVLKLDDVWQAFRRVASGYFWKA